MENISNKRVLVTGANGYIASHLIKALLKLGYQVRGTVISLESKRHEFIYDLVPDKNDNLEIVEANLTQESCWLPVLKNIDYVFSVASAVPGGHAQIESAFVHTAVNGTLSILNAAVKNKVKRVVMTSSVGAMCSGNEDKIITESDWSVESKCDSYGKSKLLSEKTAWDFYEKNKDKLELSVVNPSFVFGPVFKSTNNATCEMILSILNGDNPGVIETTLPIVDVRDVVEVHLKAMFTDIANGQRYICSSKEVSWQKIVFILKNEFEKYDYAIKDKQLTLEDAQESNSMLLVLLPFFGKKIRISNEKSCKELSIQYRPIEKTLIETGYSLIQYGALPGKIKQK